MHTLTLFLNRFTLQLTITSGCFALCFMPMANAQQDNDGQALGRLFSAPKERAILDAHRKNPIIKKQAAPKITFKPNVKPEKKYVPLPAPITMQGYVKRSDGPNTVWINHQPVSENTTVDDVKIGRLSDKKSRTNSVLTSKQKQLNTDQLTINIPTNGQSIKLKAGQRYAPEDNRVSEITAIARENQIHLKESSPDLLVE